MSKFRVTITKIQGCKNSRRNTQPYEVIVKAMDFNIGPVTHIDIPKVHLPYNNDGPHESKEPVDLWTSHLVFAPVGPTAPLTVHITADHLNFGRADLPLNSGPDGANPNMVITDGSVLGDQTQTLVVNTLGVNDPTAPPKGNQFIFHFNVVQLP